MPPGSAPPPGWHGPRPARAGSAVARRRWPVFTGSMHLGRGAERFADRVDAGRALGALVAQRLGGHDNVLVLGLPRGGVPVAAQVARAIGAELDVLLVRKI